MPPRKDSTKGTDPLLLTEIPITIQGSEYKMRRLGIPDAFKTAGIIRTIVTSGGSDLVSNPALAAMGIEALTMAIGLGFIHAEDDFLPFLASLLQTEEKVVRDPSRFPMAALPDLCKALYEHPDLNPFFLQMRARMAEQLQTAPANGATQMISP